VALVKKFSRGPEFARQYRQRQREGVLDRPDFQVGALIILAIDTTSELGSIAIVDGERVIEEVVLQRSDGFDHVLFGEIENLLARNKLRLGDIEGFASASGPGTFHRRSRWG